MKAIHIFLAFLLLPGAVLAQDSGQEPDSSANKHDLAAEVKALREALTQTQKQLAAQQQRDRNVEGAIEDRSGPRLRTSYHNGRRTERMIRPHPPVPPARYLRQQISAAATQQGRKKTGSAPLGVFKFGDAVLTLGGFVDLENIFRTTNTQSNIATAFASIPYSNTPQGNITEFRTTAQFSRLSVKVTDSFKGNIHRLR